MARLTTTTSEYTRSIRSACIAAPRYADRHVIARPGGDEFCVIAENLREVINPIRIAECIQHALAKPFVLEQQPVYTVGWCSTRPCTRRRVTLRRRADVGHDAGEVWTPWRGVDPAGASALRSHDASWIHQIARVQPAFDGPHHRQRDRGFIVFQRVDLEAADAVFG